MLDNPIPYKLKIDKASKGKKIADKGDTIYVYDISHGDVLLAKNAKGETFSVRAIDVQKI